MKLNTTHKVLIGGGVLALAVLAFWYLRNRKPNADGVLLLGGLDTRSSDKKITEQEELLKKGLGDGVKTKSFRYTDPQGLIAEIKQDPNTNVVLFSAGCSNAEQVATEMKANGGSLKNIFIVEPYHVGEKATKSVRAAVELGVPEKNVLVGSYKQAGLGIVPNATRTPNCSPKHWCSLSEVGKIILKTK